jgi:hypothetical protein
VPRAAPRSSPPLKVNATTPSTQSRPGSIPLPVTGVLHARTDGYLIAFGQTTKTKNHEDHRPFGLILINATAPLMVPK